METPTLRERLIEEFDEEYGDYLNDSAPFALKWLRTALTTLEAAAREEGNEKYQELLLAVGNKYEGETRHETALRYIRQAEQRDTPAAKSEDYPAKPSA